MSDPEPTNPAVPNVPVVLLTGASGYVGGWLIPLLERQPVALRCLARTPDKLRPLVNGPTQVVRGDVLDPPSLAEAMLGVHTAYYLVHLMSSSKDFVKDDKRAATRTSRPTCGVATRWVKSSARPASKQSSSGPGW